jgi:hypothetical protein
MQVTTSNDTQMANEPIMSLISNSARGSTSSFCNAVNVALSASSDNNVMPDDDIPTFYVLLFFNFQNELVVATISMRDFSILRVDFDSSHIIYINNGPFFFKKKKDSK